MEMVGSASKFQVVPDSVLDAISPKQLERAHARSWLRGLGDLGKNSMPSFVEDPSVNGLKGQKADVTFKSGLAIFNVLASANAFSGSAHFCLTVHFAQTH